jgi:hypothetical protein
MKYVTSSLSLIFFISFAISGCTLSARFTNLNQGSLSSSDGSQNPDQGPSLQAPAKPTGLIALATSISTINLTWTSTNSAETKYRIAYAAGRLPPANCNAGTLISQDLIVGLSYSLSGLTPATRYTFRVCAINENDSSLISTGITATATTYFLPPPNPSGLAITVHSNSGMTLSWVSGGGSTSGYKIAYATGAVAPADCTSGTQVHQNFVNGTSWYINTLTSSTQYSFRVCAVNSNPIPDVSSGIFSSATTMSIPPPDPTGLSATTNSISQITLNWTSGGGTTTGYLISYYAGTTAPATCYMGIQIPSAQITGVSKAISSLANSTDYAFRLCAVAADGTMSAGITVTGSTFVAGQTLAGTVVPATGASVIVQVGSHEVIFSPKFIGGNSASDFIIALNTGAVAPANCGVAGNVPGLVTSGFVYADGREISIHAGLVPSTQYSGIICGASNSSFSAPTAFTFTTLAALGPGSANSIGEVADFYVKNGFGGFGAEIWGNPTAATEGTYYYVSYVVGAGAPPAYCSGAKIFGNNSSWRNTWQSNAGAISYSTFTAGQTYTFRVCNSSDTEYKLDLTTRSAGVTYTWTKATNTTPGNPTGLTTTPVGWDKVQFNMTVNTTLTDQVKIFTQEGTTGGTGCSGGYDSHPVLKPNLQLTKSGLKSNTIYTFTICSLGYNFVSSSGLVVTITTGASPAVAPNPTGFSATALNQNTVRLNFASGGGTTVNYKVSWNSTGVLPVNCSVASTGSLSVQLASTSTLISGLTPGLTYAFRMCASNGDIPIVYSSGSTATVTLGSSPPAEVTNLKIKSKTESEIVIEWTSTDPTAVNFAVTYSEGAMFPPDCMTGTSAAQSGTNKMTRTISGLTNGTAYGFRVCSLSASTPASMSAGATVIAYTNLGPGTEILTSVDIGSGKLLDFSFAGDTNADGKDDFVFGSTQDTFVISSNANRDWTETLRSFSVYGTPSYYGDYNNDGYDDFIVGTETSRLNVVSGKDGTTMMNRGPIIESDYLGRKSAVTNDLDADGYQDIIATAPFTRNATGVIGAVYAISGKTGGVLWTRQGTTYSEMLGYSMVVIDDVNSDSIKDVVVGGPGFDGACGTDCGHVLILNGANGSILYEFLGQTALSAFGTAVASLGDLQNNGAKLIGIGAPDFTGTAGALAGKTYVYNTVSHSLVYSNEGAATNVKYGSAISSASDFDDDGYLDYIVGAPGLEYQSGTIQIRSGFNNSIIESITRPLNAGSTLGLVGDFDGDGKLDIGVADSHSIYIIRGRTAPVPP